VNTVQIPKFFRVVFAPTRLVTFDFVTVGAPGNAPDHTGYGSVPYTFQIGTYEVTFGQYATFLNAVDPNGDNALELYSRFMTDIRGGIFHIPSNPVGSRYELIAGADNRPLLFVSIIDAMRFCNWVHNGAQPGGDTEDGAYTLLGGGASPSNAATVTRNPGAKVFRTQ